MDTNFLLYNPEVWGGVECTINRIEDRFRNQLEEAGHYQRDDDIEKMASTGIKKLRYPVLWEDHQVRSDKEVIDWSRTRKQLEKIRSQGITPIAGLLHHGSGPAFTDLMDDSFPEKFAHYAGKVAREFPWLEYYTPVNEPLTTARFSGLYGHWYPHKTDDESFSKMLLNQLKGIVLAMAAIREVNPDAKLVQTEDLAKVHSVPDLEYQTAFENQRRWLSFDFLCGRVDENHVLWQFMNSQYIPEAHIRFFSEHPCPPQVIGVNYYVTSERYLDPEIKDHPAETHGGNGKQKYADIAAVRKIEPAGIKNLVRETWERYHIPIALTEIHMHCTREEQLRWFKEAWDKCRELISEGVALKAVTAWSFFGAFDWNSLLTRNDKIYESGVFELNNNTLRPTALATMIRSLSESGNYEHPLLAEKGWWHKSYPGHKPAPKSNTSPVLIFGAKGTLGTAFANICRSRSIPFRALSRAEADITDPAQIHAAIEKYKPWAVINTSGYVRVDDAETNKEQCFKINAAGNENIALHCQKAGIRFVTFSTDLVFDGQKASPYLEADQMNPLNVYGSSKASGERLVNMICPEALIIRTSSFFGPWDRYNFAFHILESLKDGKCIPVVNDIVISPTYVPHLVHRALDLLIDMESGIWHITNDGFFTWHDFAKELACRNGYSLKKIIGCSQAQMQWPAKRPLFSALKSSRGIQLPRMEKAVEQYFHEKMI